jgi:hypothetical protein
VSVFAHDRSATAANPDLIPSLPAARALLLHFGDTRLGVSGGHFTDRLLVLLSAADDENKLKLAEHWPELVYGYEVIGQTTWGLDWMRDVVKKATR